MQYTSPAMPSISAIQCLHTTLIKEMQLLYNAQKCIILADIGVRDGGAGGAAAPPQFGQFVDMNSGRESTLFGQNTIDVR